MTLTWVEDNNSRQASIVRLGRKASSSYVKSYKIFGSTDDVEVHDDVGRRVAQGLLYWQYPGQPLNKFFVESYALSYLGDDAWQLTLNYTKEGAEDDEQPEPLKRTRSFDTGGASQRITQGRPVGEGEALDFEKRFPDAAANQSGAIGVDGDTVAGVDIVIPQLSWTESYDVPNRFVTAQYIKHISGLTGSVNSAEFRTFKPGEVLFLGASGSQEWDEDRGDGPWSLSYKFLASANAGEGEYLPSLTIGEITGIEKKGHEYLWVRYEADVDEDVLIKKPKAVYVNAVYRSENFAQLGIGVA
jgi:hypothetical protein